MNGGRMSANLYLVDNSFAWPAMNHSQPDVVGVGRVYMIGKISCHSIFWAYTLAVYRLYDTAMYTHYMLACSNADLVVPPVFSPKQIYAHYCLLLREMLMYLSRGCEDTALLMVFCWSW